MAGQAECLLGPTGRGGAGLVSTMPYIWDFGAGAKKKEAELRPSRSAYRGERWFGGLDGRPSEAHFVEAMRTLALGALKGRHDPRPLPAKEKQCRGGTSIVR